MPETFAVVGAWLAGGTEAAGIGTAAMEIGAAEIAAGGSGAAFSAAGAGGLGLSAAEYATIAGGGVAAGSAVDVAGLTAADAAAYGSGGDTFLSSGGYAGLAGDGPGSISALFSNLGSTFGPKGGGTGAIQVLSSLYGMDQSRKLQKAGQGQGATKAGLDAVMRGMAAQGYQGSGNMMAALERYGAETNQGNPAMQQAGLTGQLSSLGLLTSGLPKLFGWGDDSGKGK